MTRTLLVTLMVLTFTQAGSQPYVGTWTAELAGTTYVRLELAVVAGTISGKISLGDIEVDKQGEVNKAVSAPKESTPIFDVRLRESGLSFSRKESNDTDQFEMRLVGNGTAELRLLLSEADLKELAAEGVPAPKPFRLKKG